MYNSPDIEELSSQHEKNNISPTSEKKRTCRWFYCGQEPFTVRRSISEASMYRANSRFSLRSENKTLDYLMNCFWVCSSGCQQT